MSSDPDTEQTEEQDTKTITVRRTLEYDIEIPVGLNQSHARAAVDEAMVSSTAEAARERFNVLLYDSDWTNQ
jgi:hypothetical protein